MRSLLEVQDLSVRFAQRRSLPELLLRQPARQVGAVEQVSFTLGQNETLGLVGESGCGKTTLGRAILGLLPRSGGEVRIDGTSLDQLAAGQSLPFRRKVQMIFQDPFAALNPKLTIAETIGEVLRVHRLCPRNKEATRVAELLQEVGLPPEIATRRPRALSGGQCQRVVIARALALEPKLIVADESVSALDVSIQAQVLNLFARLRRERDLAILFISHDLSVVRYLCQRVAVMYLGRIVELGPTEQIFNTPKHPYTQALLAAKPRLNGPGLRDLPLLAGEPPSPLDLPDGCAFHPRCPQAMSVCRSAPLPAARPAEAAQVACHLYDEQP